VISERMARRPRVLIVITLSEVGGAQKYVAQLLPGLAERFDVAVAAGGGPLRYASKAAGVRFLPLRNLHRPINPLRDLLALVELISLIRRERPDIVHANSSKAGVLGRLAAVAARVPIRIFTVHGWAFTAYSGPASWAYLCADRLAGRWTTVTICVAEHERSSGITARTCRSDRTVVIPNAVDVSAAPVANVNGGTPRLVTVGRLKAPKDYGTLTRAFAALPSGTFEALIVGDGPDRPKVEAELVRLGLANAVRLLGERTDVPVLLAGSDVFVLSSTSEGLPLSVEEAMAAGLPVVASAVGGVPELVVDGETGYLVPPGDAERLAEALGSLLDDPALRLRMGRSGRARAEELFNLTGFRRAHVELYSRELAKRGMR
jgi:glycosyltransferase involved in cell wall biosynthesis